MKAAAGSAAETQLKTSLRFGPFRWTMVAQLTSFAGDQIGRVAVSVLVFEQTGSALAAAAAFALSLAPVVVGTFLLSQLADEIPPRRLLVSIDVLRAAAFALMAVPSVPTALVLALLVASVSTSGVFTGTAAALAPRLVDAEALESAMTVRQLTNTVGNLLGYGLGALVVGIVGPRAGLAVDAATFLASALLLRFGLPQLTVAAPGRARRGREIGASLRLLFAEPRRRGLVAGIWLVGAWVVPESLAPAYASQLGGGSGATVILFVAIPIGSVLGSMALLRQKHHVERHERLAYAMLGAAGLPLAVGLSDPPLAGVVALWFVTGLMSGYLPAFVSTIVKVTTAADRARFMIYLNAGLVVAQGLAAIAAGALAEAWPAKDVVGTFGVLGVVAAASIVWRWWRQLDVEKDGSGEVGASIDVTAPRSS